MPNYIKRWWDTDDRVVAAVFHPDEDYWQNAVAPQPAGNTLQLTAIASQDQPEIFPQGAHGQNATFVWPQPKTIRVYQAPPDDEYPTIRFGQGQNATFVWPQPRTIRVHNQPPDEEIIPKQDEDYWQNWVAPVPAANFIVPLVLDPEADVPAGSLHGQFEDDSWQNWVRPVVPVVPIQATTDTDEIFPQVTPKLDEDYWQNWVVPLQQANFFLLPLLGDDSSDLPILPFDEEPWNNAVAPVVSSNLIQLPVGDQSEEFLAPKRATGQNVVFIWPQPKTIQIYRVPPNDDITVPVSAEEDYWQNPTPPVWFQNLPPILGDDSNDLPLITFDEEPWTNLVAPVQSTNVIQLPLLDQSEEYLAPKRATGQNTTLVWPQPKTYTICYQPPDEEIFPQATLQVDEDYWAPNLQQDDDGIVTIWS